MSSRRRPPSHHPLDHPEDVKGDPARDTSAPRGDDGWNEGPVLWSKPDETREEASAPEALTPVEAAGAGLDEGKVPEERPPSGNPTPASARIAATDTDPASETGSAPNDSQEESEMPDSSSDPVGVEEEEVETPQADSALSGEPAPSPTGSDSTPPRGPRRRGRLARTLIFTFKAGFVLGILGIATAIGVVWWYSRDLPRFDSLKDYHPRQTTRVLASDGSEIGDIFRDLRRTVVPANELPPVMIQALISAEDANFFEHRGVDYFGIVKAVVTDVLRGSRLRGASTLTQQTVKTFLLSGERKISRKIREAILAHRLEQNLSKDDILYLYLNQIEFGDGRAGIEEAARYYFGKSIRDIELGEAAVLAAIPKSPNRLNPRRHPQRSRARRNYVLHRMAENGYIPPEVARREMERPIELAPLPSTPRPGGYYLAEVRRTLTAELGPELVETGGLIVKTAMHPVIQARAEEAVRQGLREVDKRQGFRGALGRMGEDEWKALAPHLLPPPLDDPAVVRNRNRLRTLPDLRLVDVPSVTEADGDAEQLSRLAGAVRWHVLEPGREVVVRVDSVTRTEAIVPLGPHIGRMSFNDTRWARKWNPARGTAAPRSMNDVMKPGDMVLARVVSVGQCLDAEEDGDESSNSTGCTSRDVRLALEQDPRAEAALVAIEPETRGVMALVGGFSHTRSPFNRATQARRQSGSAFKPLVYAAAIESGKLTPFTTVYDTPELIRDRWTGKPWTPQNYTRNVFDGPMTLRESLARSKNTVAVKLIADMAREPGVDDDTAQDLGLARVHDVSWRAGIDSTLPESLTTALGSGEVTPLEMVNAFTTLASEGRWSEPVMIRRVLTPDGRVLIDNKAVFERPAPPPRTRVEDELAKEWGAEHVFAGDERQAELAGNWGRRHFDGEGHEAEGGESGSREGGDTGRPEGVLEHRGDVGSDEAAGHTGRGLRPGVAYVTLDMMRSVVESPRGTARSMQAVGRPVAGKTGTASDHRDAWFVGFTPELVAGTWVGFDDHSTLGPSETGGRAAAPIWRQFMLEIEDRLPRRQWTPPDDVAVVDIDPRTGLLADERSPYLEREVFLRGTEPTEYSPSGDVATQDDFLRGQGP